MVNKKILIYIHAQMHKNIDLRTQRTISINMSNNEQIVDLDECLSINIVYDFNSIYNFNVVIEQF